MAKFNHILRNRDFFLLWIGQIISQLGDRLDQMALIAFVYQRTPGSSVEIAKILSFTIIPVFLVGPIAGVYVDRWDRRRTLYISDLCRSILVLIIPLFLFYSKNIVGVYCIIFLVFSIGRFFVPAKLSIIPEVVQESDLLIANSLINTTGMIAAILGFGISGVLIEWMGARSGFYLDSLSFVVSALLIFFISKKSIKRTGLPQIRQEIAKAISKSLIQELKEGIVYFFQNSRIRSAAGIIFLLWSALGAVYVVVIVFVQKTLHSATKDLGLLVMFLGIGLFSGSLLYGRFGQKQSHFKIIFVCLTLSGIMLIVFALGIAHFPSFLVAAVLSCMLGITISPIMIASNTIIHNASDNHMMGKIFSSLEIVMHLGFLLFMFLGSLLAERFSHETLLISVGCMILLWGTVQLLVHHKNDWESQKTLFESKTNDPFRRT